MKFVVIIVASVCANLYFCAAGNISGNQKLCADCEQPITVNVYGKGCQKNPNKPAAHIESANKKVVNYRANQMIKDWSVSAPYSYLVGGMKYHDGKLTVPTTGRYNIYLQLYYHSTGRVYAYVNSKPVTMIQAPISGKSDQFTAYTAGVFNLKSGDVITFVSASDYCKLYMWTFHTYFGAYLI